MADRWQLLFDAAILAIILIGIWRFRDPRAASSGNLLVGAALFCALGIVVFRSPAHALWIAGGALAVGSLGGLSIARRVNMTQIPATIGFQNGAGGLASCLVSFVELSRGSALSGIGEVAGVFALLVGAVTFSGSMVASGKLAGLMRQAPLAIRGHRGVLAAGLAIALALGFGLVAASGSARVALATGTLFASLLCGILFSIRVGGADMPVLISLLNAWSGLSAGFCGVVMQSQVLTACGATVAASGLILTHAMCRAMNRSLAAVLLGGAYGPLPASLRETPVPQPEGAGLGPRDGEGAAASDPFVRAAELIAAAAKVIFVPGYGMALAHAQRPTVQLANRIRQMGKEVKFAVHPLAGRMPGHMHVLLAEAEIDPDMLFDLDEVNCEFAAADLAVVVGACDVVNPAATSVPGTPISGMPILEAQEAKGVLVCNLDDRPGYSGVNNPLYSDPKTVLLLGDAAATLAQLIERVQ
ncbi:MAG: NAD(P)(+) transhydrogenase (Re/Si-specific) subunit beta [Thermoguttaceae bacterium]|jgi:NAD(P) transhydrogenase subunit beta